MTQEDGVGDYAQRLADIATKDTDDELAGPYKGLLTYRLSDSALFIGRDQAIADLYGPHPLVHQEPSVVQTVASARSLDRDWRRTRPDSHLCHGARLGVPVIMMRKAPVPHRGGFADLSLGACRGARATKHRHARHARHESSRWQSPLAPNKWFLTIKWGLLRFGRSAFARNDRCIMFVLMKYQELQIRLGSA
jgi:hypothetical protein